MNWADVYRPLVGRELEACAFLPITCDTRSVVASLNCDSFWFSGLVHLCFRGPENLFLSWRQTGPDIALMADRGTNVFGNYTDYDRINMSSELPWGALNHARLSGVAAYAVAGIAPQLAVALHHKFLASTGRVSLWICTGYEPEVGDGDDLLVKLGDHPPCAALLPIITLGS